MRLGRHFSQGGGHNSPVKSPGGGGGGEWRIILSRGKCPRDILQ